MERLPTQACNSRPHKDKVIPVRQRVQLLQVEIKS